uniref:Reverse transcriptase domain-containing protein n=1 Tax=Tanacetum cinerariifolium TaxID=118510 RepID=A0A6L2J5H6_TANCI|nr:reverse transcriptase domain-containing protein [Tanacetum cinerariifolium]
MADMRTMSELLQAPTKGYEDAIVIPAILAENFELKVGFLSLVTSSQFHGFERDDPHSHIRWFNKITSTLKYKNVSHDAIKLMLFLFSLEGAARTWLEKEPPRYIHAWEDLVKELLLNVNAAQQATVKAIEETCVTCGEPHPYYECLVTDGKTFDTYAAVGPYNQEANSRGDLKAITTRRGVAYEGPLILPTSSFSKEVEREPEVTKDKVQTTSSESTAHVQPPVIQVPTLEPEVATNPNPKPFVDALLHMPKFASTFKSLLSNKKKLFELASTPLNENCSAVLLKNLPQKLGDPGKFLIPCDLPKLEECLALADLGASIDLMPLSVWKKLSLPELTPTRMTLELANRSVAYPVGVAEDVFVKVGKFYFPADFVVVDYDVDPWVTLILEKPFLRTARALSINYYNESVNRIVYIDVSCEEYAQEVLGFLDSSTSGNPTPSDPIIASSSSSFTPFEGSDFILEEIQTFLCTPNELSTLDDDFDSEGDSETGLHLPIFQSKQYHFDVVVFSPKIIYKIVKIRIRTLIPKYRGNTHQASSAPQPIESTTSQASKRKSADVRWEFEILADLKHIDKVKCNICGKIVFGGIHGLKLHVTGIPGDVTTCTKSTTEQQLKCRNVFNEVKINKKCKQAAYDALSSVINIGTIGGLPRFKKTLDQAKNIMIFIYAHHKTLVLMRHFTKKRDIMRPRVTRFAFAFLTLQSLARKKSPLRRMFSSDEWEKCKFSKTVKGKAAYASPSMGFIYVELKKVKQEILDALINNEKAYALILDIISRKASGRLDTALHISAYILKPYYLYNDLEVQKDDDLNDAIVELPDSLFGEDYNIQNQITLHEFPMYKGKLEKFGRAVAIKGYEVNDEKYDPALWWSMYRGSTPNLKKVAMRILSLTTGLFRCERNWGTFEGGDVYEDGGEAALPRETDSDGMGTDEVLRTQTSARLREIYDKQFESKDEVEVDEEIKYESDGVHIIEQYRPDEDGASISCHKNAIFGYTNSSFAVCNFFLSGPCSAPLFIVILNRLLLVYICRLHRWGRDFFYGRVLMNGVRHKVQNLKGLDKQIIHTKWLNGRHRLVRI